MCNWVRQRNYEYYIDDDKKLIIVRKPYVISDIGSSFDNEEDMKNIAAELIDILPDNTYDFRFLVNKANQDLPYELKRSEI